MLYTIYLLHADPPAGRIRHYVGITRKGRLARRLAEHASGRGSTTTARMLRAGSTLTLAAALIVNDPRAERQIKMRGHFRRWCPICSGCHRDPRLATYPHLSGSPSTPQEPFGLAWHQHDHRRRKPNRP